MFGRPGHLMVGHDPPSFLVVSEHGDWSPAASYGLAFCERERLRYRVMAKGAAESGVVAGEKKRKARLG
jgi:hypothetical protein